VYRTILIIPFLIFAYFSLGAYLLYAQMPRFLFPNIALTAKTGELHKIELSDILENELIIREYGESQDQCIVFFPGRHGGIIKYEEHLFRPFTKNNFKVFSLSYSGQDGAKGHINNITSLIALIREAMMTISLKCSPDKTVIYGRSLGATIAAYSASKSNVSGVILESVAPSLSEGVINYLNSKWYLSSLNILPIGFLLPKDYKLTEPLSLLKNTPVSIFQGVQDSQTPLKQLQNSWDYGDNVSLHVVKAAGHSDTYIQAIDEIVKVAKNMLVKP
jgi:predicted alpha/beta-fold hydrolase